METKGLWDRVGFLERPLRAVREEWMETRWALRPGWFPRGATESRQRGVDGNQGALRPGWFPEHATEAGLRGGIGNQGALGRGWFPGWGLQAIMLVKCGNQHRYKGRRFP